MQNTDLDSRTFRLSSRDLGLFAGCIAMSIVGLMAVAGVATVAAEMVFGPLEDLEGWLEAAVLAEATTVVAAAGWGMWRVWKPRLSRWLEARELPDEEETGETLAR